MTAVVALLTLMIAHIFHPTYSAPLTTQQDNEHWVLNEYIRNFREILGEAHRLYVSKYLDVFMFCK